MTQTNQGLSSRALPAMPLMAHLKELRHRLLYGFLGLAAGVITSAFWARELLLLLRRPLEIALPGGSLHFTGPLDVFMAEIKVACLIGFMISLPIWLYQLWKFVEPGLYPQEQRYLFPFLISSTLLFTLGVAFCFWGVLPVTLKFLLTLGQQVGEPMITISDYLSMVILMLLTFGVVFETPLILLLLAGLGWVHSSSLRAARRYAFVGALIFSALVTSPDPLSQLAMTAPLYIMYELSILIISIWERRRLGSSQ